LIEPMKRIGREVIAVAPDRCSKLIKSADSHLVVEGDVEEFFSPVVLPTGCELFASFLADYTHDRYFRDDVEVYEKGNIYCTSENFTIKFKIIPIFICNFFKYPFRTKCHYFF